MNDIATPVAFPAPSIEALERLVEDATISDIMLTATAGFDDIVTRWSDSVPFTPGIRARTSGWGRFTHFSAVPEYDSYRVDGEIASMNFGMSLKSVAGFLLLASATIRAGTLRDSLVLLSVEPCRPADDPACLPDNDDYDQFMAEAFDLRADIRDAFAHEVACFAAADLLMLSSPDLDRRLRALAPGFGHVVTASFDTDPDMLEKSFTCLPHADAGHVYVFRAEGRAVVATDTDPALSIAFDVFLVGTFEDDTVGFKSMLPAPQDRPGIG